MYFIRYRREWSTRVPHRLWHLENDEQERKVIDRRLERIKLGLLDAEHASTPTWVRL